jgi:glucose/arabinose dehydrogenase
MTMRLTWFLPLALLATLLGRSVPATAQAQPDWIRGKNLTLRPIVTGLREPTFVTGVPGSDNELWTLERHGLIRAAIDGQLQETPVLDLTASVGVFSEEEGLVGLAFDPGFAFNRRVYVDYTANDWSVHIVRYTLSASNPSTLEPVSAQVVLVIPKHSRYHNGGMLEFGRDGLLYISVGDDEASDQAQLLGSLVGKILRIDVTSAPPYAIPNSNPFAQQAGARGEIWAYGFRNPWRFSFDRATGDLWVGDVGDAMWEEVDMQPASSAGGEDYGWPFLEGLRCVEEAYCHDPILVAPLVTYDHNMNCAVIGGYVYRGDLVPALKGKYLYGDLCTGGVFTLASAHDPSKARVELGYQPIKISSFGEDTIGEVYVIDFQGGTIYRIEDGLLPTSGRNCDVDTCEMIDLTMSTH